MDVEIPTNTPKSTYMQRIFYYMFIIIVFPTAIVVMCSDFISLVLLPIMITGLLNSANDIGLGHVVRVDNQDSIQCTMTALMDAGWNAIVSGTT